MKGASLSAAQRLHTCPGSAVLDRVDSLGGQAGSAGHEYLAILVPDGREAADAAMPAILERWEIDEREAGFLVAKLRRFAPPIPEHALAEVALCLLDDRSVVPVVGARGQYETPANAVIAGSLDVMWSEPEPLRWEPCAAPESGTDGGRWVCPPGSTLWLADYKLGADRNVPRAERNRQIRWGAALAARWTGAERVVSAIVYVEGAEGRWDYRQHPAAWAGAAPLPHPYDRAELTAIEDEILADHARWQEQRRRREAGEALDLTTGGHCEYCPSRTACPAQIAEPRALVALPSERITTGPLTDEEASRWAEALPRLKRAVKGVEEALRARAEATGRPIGLGDGRVYGPQATSEKTFLTRLTYETLVEVLAELAGDEQAAEIADGAFAASAAAMERAVGLAAQRAGASDEMRKAAQRRLFARLKERGAVVPVPSSKWQAHHPVTALPVVTEALAAPERTGT